MDVQLNPVNDLAIIEKKRSSWALMGVKIYQQELELQVRAQDALRKLEVLPTTIDDVPAAETALKEVGILKRQIETDRKSITSKFDPVFERLMAPEKSFAVPMAAYVAAIIAIKKEEERKAQERKNKTDELARIRQALITTQAHYDAEFKTIIAEKVMQAFAKALESNKKPEEKQDYMDRVCFRVKESNFLIETPNVQLQYATHQEFNKILNEVWKINAADYVSMFAIELEKKFSDYSVAYLNKQQALQLAREEQQRRLQEIAQQKQQTEIAATLDSVSTDMSIEPSGLKALKKAYEVDMPETFDSVMKIFSAFMANKQKCLEKVNIKKWFVSFNADSAAKALAKVKSDDNAFAPIGIVWKEVVKL
jgi:hypothetical protein